MALNFMSLYLLNLFLIWSSSVPQITTQIYMIFCRAMNISRPEGMVSNPIWTFLCGIWPSLCIIFKLPNIIVGIFMVIGLLLPLLYSYIVTIYMIESDMHLSKNKVFMILYFMSLYIYIPATCLGNTKFLYWTTY